MNKNKLIQIGLGTVAVCLLLFMAARPFASKQQTVLAHGVGEGSSAQYLPLVMRPFTFTTTRVSVTSDGTQGNGGSSHPSISVDGRYVAFVSSATNLVSGDTNDYGDIFIHDRQTGEISRISVASDGTQGNGRAYEPSVSADGRYITFISEATNLVGDDTNDTPDAFVHDRQTGETGRVSVASNGGEGYGGAWSPFISSDGRYVIFTSSAPNLVNGDTNYSSDVFVHDRQTGETSRVSVASDGAQGNGNSGGSSISTNGRYVAFTSWASNLVSNDTNGTYDAFVHDRQTGETNRISVAFDGTQGNSASGTPVLSADHRYVAFNSSATNLVSGDTNNVRDVFIHDRQTGETTRVSVASDGTQGDRESGGNAISADGRYIAFTSWATNLVSNDTNGTYDIFVHDRQTDQTSRISLASDGTQGNSNSWGASISANGRYITFDSDARNLVSGDTNGQRDIFVHDQGQ